MKYISIILLMPVILIFACSGKNPTSPVEATDQEAIYNVLFQDNYRIVAFDFLNLAIPDTAAFLANPDPEHPCIWHDIQFTSENLPIVILDEPVQSPVGLVREAHVTYTVVDTGKFRILMYNAVADSIERDSARFSYNISRAATCQQWGRSNAIRRGWLLTQISDLRITSGQDYVFLSNLKFSSLTHHDTSFAYGNHSPDELLSFIPSEEVTFHYQKANVLDRVFIYLPDNNYGYRLAEPQQDSLGIWRAGVTMPSVKIYGQMFFLVVNVGNFDQAYSGIGYSYNYRIR